MATPLDLVLAALPEAKRAASGWLARCPAHDDRTPSLSIGEGEQGQALLHCHAGCPVDRVCEALGLAPRDLWPSGPREAQAAPPPPKRTYATAEEAQQAALRSVRARNDASWRLVDVAPYDGMDGAEIMQALRFEPADGTAKEYRPISRGRDGRWRMQDPPGPLPLYGLSHLGGDELVLVVEGEKAAEAAREIGLLATTSSHGAKAAGRTDWTPLSGRRVAILPDNDEPGQGYALDVARTLRGLDPLVDIRIVQLPDLPEHGDVVEHIASLRARGLDERQIRKDILARVERASPYIGLDVRGVSSATPSGGSVSAPPGTLENSQGASGASVGTHLAPTQKSRGASVGSVSGGGAQSADFEFNELRELPSPLPPVPDFSFELLPAAIRGWIRDIAERMQCPAVFPAVAAIVALASLIGRKLGIRPKRRDDWLVVCNLWGMIIGRPGIMKTPPLEEATRPIKRLEVEAKKAFDDAVKAQLAASLVSKATKAEGQKAVRKALKKGQEEALAVAKEFVGEDDSGAGPIRRRYVINDVTVEKLGEILNQNPNGVLLYRDELIGFLRGLDREGQEAARSFYLEAWNGIGRFTYDRIARGTIDIEAAIISIVGSIQPGPLGTYLTSTIRGGSGDDGLLGRFQLAVWPDVVPGWENVDRWPDARARDEAYEVFRALDELSADDVGAERDKMDPGGVPFLRFTDEAQEEFDAWRARLEHRLRSGDEHPAFEAHLSKYRSLIPSLALLFHVVDVRRGRVGIEALRRSLALADFLEAHARRIYAVAIHAEAHAARALSKALEKGELQDGFTARDVYRRGWTGLTTTEEVHGAIDVLVDCGWLAELKVETKGRPKLSYAINPRILLTQGTGTDKADGSPEVGRENAQAPSEAPDRTAGSPSENAEARQTGTDRTARSAERPSDHPHPPRPDGTDRSPGGPPSGSSGRPPQRLFEDLEGDDAGTDDADSGDWRLA